MSPVRGESATCVGRLKGLPPCSADGVSGSPSVKSSLPSGSELPNGVVQVVGEPHRPVGADRDAVRPAEDALAPRAKKIPVAIEHDDRMLAAIEEMNVVLGVHGAARRLHEKPCLGQAPPALDRPVVHRCDLLIRAYTATTR